MTGKANFLCNFFAALILLPLAVWNAVVDATLGSHLLLQPSWALPLLTLFVTLWFLVGMVVNYLPKRFLIPATILLVLRTSLGWPLSLASGLEAACHIVNVALATLALLYLIWTLTRPQRLRVAPWFRWQHTALVLGSWIVLNVASLFTTVFGFAHAIDELTLGYVQITPRGITFAERVFEKDNHQVHLIGLAHIGEGDFYKELKKSFRKPSEGGRLILTEGVTDEKDVLPEGFKSGKTYGNLASQLGLEQQKDFESGGRKEDGPSWEELGVSFKHADIDISLMDPAHLELLVKVLETMDSESLLESFIASSSITVTAEEMESFFLDGLIGQRNDHLMEVFYAEHQDYDETYIPWGAAHLPDLERRLLADGFRLVEEKKRIGIDFWP
ncbi:MAG: hypothetical protein AAGA96_19740 [Verrucomicrobiota bacterium]